MISKVITGLFWSGCTKPRTVCFFKDTGRPIMSFARCGAMWSSNTWVRILMKAWVVSYCFIFSVLCRYAMRCTLSCMSYQISEGFGSNNDSEQTRRLTRSRKNKKNKKKFTSNYRFPADHLSFFFRRADKLHAPLVDKLSENAVSWNFSTSCPSVYLMYGLCHEH